METESEVLDLPARYTEVSESRVVIAHDTGVLNPLHHLILRRQNGRFDEMTSKIANQLDDPETVHTVTVLLPTHNLAFEYTPENRRLKKPETTEKTPYFFLHEQRYPSETKTYQGLMQVLLDDKDQGRFGQRVVITDSKESADEIAELVDGLNIDYVKLHK